MPRLLNWELLRNPYNWIMVYAMLALAVLFITFINQEAGNA